MIRRLVWLCGDTRLLDLPIAAGLGMEIQFVETVASDSLDEIRREYGSGDRNYLQSNKLRAESAKPQGDDAVAATINKALRQLRSARELRAEMLSLAAELASGNARGHLTVLDAVIAAATVQGEWGACSQSSAKTCVTA